MLLHIFALDHFVIGVITLICFLCFWHRRPKLSPPGPFGLPIIGCPHYLLGKPEQITFKLSKKYGPIVSVRIGSRDVVWLNDFVSIQKAFISNGATMSDRPGISAFTSLKKKHGVVLIDYGRDWESQRKFGLVKLRGLGFGKKGMEIICNNELNCLVEELNTKTKSALDISSLIYKGVSNNICHVLFGKRYDYNDSNFAQLLDLLLSIFNDTNQIILEFLTGYIPWLKYVPPFLFYHKKMKDNLNVILDKLHEIVEEHRRTFDKHNIRDFIDAFLAEKLENTDPSFTELQLLHYIHDLFLAGTETSASTLSWAMLCLIHYPETQRKLRQEIHETLGISGEISFLKRKEMPYTNAFILELMRYRTILPFGVAHKAKSDTELGGYIIPKDTKVVANLWAIHNDVTLWKDPENFRPERFLNDQGEFVNSKFVIPFSIGRRRCLGEQLARMEIFIILVGIVQKFNVTSSSGEELPSIEDGICGAVFQPKPFKVSIDVLTSNL